MAIEARKLTKKYGDFTAVRGIDLSAKRGELFSLLGPNGAGKTTTVRMLTTLTSITSGEAHIEGHDVVKEKRRVKSIIGLVPDVSNLYDDLTIRENLKFLAKLYGAPMENVDRLIKEFNLPAERKFGRLSTGFKRRATIAAALVHEPRVLFLDEPTNGLDVQSARAVRGMIRNLNKEGVTVFLTTHNMTEAETLPHRIAIINDGRIVAEGKRHELRALLGKGVRVKLRVRPITNRLIRALDDFGVSFEEDYVTVVVNDIDAFLEYFTGVKRELGLTVVDFITEPPSIEEVFLKLTTDSSGEESGCACGGCPL
ncbi:ABC transporter ATP-binding protein [Palaeococcus ferrophilus]|uniref:ABC transporter ATP-binding protein n=1 Tax=Palaeococcus ferrophilus TaxID=83868 RepID=UPI001FDF5999|nr:ABC transporter ATP-binding protein [Palaeococcus ferrophilus]